LTAHTGIRIVTPGRTEWNAFVASSDYGHFMQTWEWGEFKSRIGWKPVRIAVEADGILRAGAQLLFRRPAACIFSLAYMPKGPVLDIRDDALTRPLFEAIHETAGKHRAVFLKTEPDFANSGEIRGWMDVQGFRPVRITNQPRCTIVLDLKAEEQALLDNMDRNARRLIRRCENQGVRIEEGDRDRLDAFYAVMTRTARMKKIPLHRKRFFEKAFDTFSETGIPRLFLAMNDGEVVGALLIFAYGKTSSHLWGGTSEKGRKLSASYPLHWAAIRWARRNGFAHTDLWGIPDEIAEMAESGQPIPADREDGLWGLYRFKKSFGGRILCYIGAYDYVYRPALYRLFTWINRKKKTFDELSEMIERLTCAR